MASATILSKSAAFYDDFERSANTDKKTTHYCPGCGHGNVHKIMAEALQDFGVTDRSVLISPVGCSVFAYYYFDIGNVQAAHGRAPAVGTGVKRAHPHSIVLSYQGDGDLAAIGTSEILHAANRGEHMTVIFINNAI
jgi:2-oxoisovalerate ferredoxin oxidoreductase beta subunit